MKIIHTSDWHLGHVLYGHTRDAEQRDFLNQLKNIVADEQPDALIVSGDIFDRAVPSNAAQKMYCDAMLKMHQVCPTMKIIITAGNHDSKSLLEINRDLWHLANVTMVGQVERREGEVLLSRHIVEVKRGDCVVGYVVAVPHIYEASYPAITGADTPAQRREMFHQALLDEVARRNTANLPVVMMAHLSLTNSSFKGHGESIGGMMAESVDSNTLGQGFDYLALGHIHCPQTMECNNAIARYCGTPIAVSFDEDYAHSVSVVTLESGETPTIVTHEIHNLVPLLTIPQNPASFEDAIKELDMLPNDVKGYIRLNVLKDAPLPPNRSERISRCMESKQSEFCTIQLVDIQQDEKNDESMLVAETLEEFQNLSPMHIADAYYRNKYNAPLPDDIAQMLRQVIEQIETEKHA